MLACISELANVSPPTKASDPDATPLPFAPSFPGFQLLPLISFISDLSISGGGAAAADKQAS